MTDSTLNFRLGNAIEIKAVDNLDGTFSIATSNTGTPLEVIRSTFPVEYNFRASPDKRILTIHGIGNVTVEAFNGVDWTVTDVESAPYGGDLTTSNWRLRFIPDAGVTIGIARHEDERVGGLFLSNEGNRFVSSEGNVFEGLGV